MLNEFSELRTLLMSVDAIENKYGCGGVLRGLAQRTWRRASGLLGVEDSSN
jgi:hypothetical protein